MFDFKFGIIWTIFMTIFTFIVVAEGELDLFILMILVIFWDIGIFMLYRGLKKVISNIFTTTKGEICFGRIDNIYNSGAYVNDRPELKADFLVYIPSIQETKVISEIIGFDPYKYSIGSYVKLKYFDGDINIESIVDNTELPFDAQEELMSSQHNNLNEKDTIVIDGVEYIRKDSV